MSKDIAKTRNVALVSHGGAGKTSLAEAILFDAGVTKRLGKVTDGTSVMDFEPEEVKRQITISAAFNTATWKKHKINIIDTPGDFNFLSDTRACIMAADFAIILVEAIDGVKVQTEKVWEFAENFNLPKIALINKMDRERADFFKTVNDIASTFNVRVVPAQLPLGKEDSFCGVVDLLTQKAFRYSTDESGSFETEDVPPDMAEDVATYRLELMEAVAEADDDLLEKYLEEGELTAEEINQGLRKAIVQGTFLPVIPGASFKNIGVKHLLDFIVDFCPSPLDIPPRKAKGPDGSEVEVAPDPDGPFSALVIKTVTDPYAGRLSVFRVFSGSLSSDSSALNSSKGEKERFGNFLIIRGKSQEHVSEAATGDVVAVPKLKETGTGDTLSSEKRPVIFPVQEPLPPIISLAVSPKTKGEEDKVFTSLARVLEEDPTLKLRRDEETKEMILSGMGEIHIEAATERLRRKFDVEVDLALPKVPYKETIKTSTEIQNRHKKQSGGRGQFADVSLRIEPLPRGEGFQFVDKIAGGVIPKQYIPAVEKGVVEAMADGVLAGYPVVDIQVAVFFGKTHPVDSSELAFKIAASMGFKKGFLECKPTLLEPVMTMEVVVPEEFMGDIMGDLNSRRGRILGMDAKGRNQVIKAQVPLAELLQYAPELRSITAGRGVFTMGFSHYDEMPEQIKEKIIAEAKAAKEEGE